MNKGTTVHIVNRGKAYTDPDDKMCKKYGATKIKQDRDPPGLEAHTGDNRINTGILGNVVSSKDNKTLVYLPKFDKEVLLDDEGLEYYQYQKGDRVKYVSGIHGYGITNPKDVIGVVKDIDDYARLPIQVERDAGNCNNYGAEDLQLVVDVPANTIPPKVFGPTYLYLEDDLKLFDTVEFGNLKYVVLKDHLSLQGKAKSGLENEEIFNVLGIGDPESWAVRPYGYTPSGSGHRPYYNDHDYKAASRAVDLLIYQLKQMTPDSIIQPVIKVRGKVIKFDKVDPLIEQPKSSDATPQDMTDQEMLDIMEAAIKALEKGEALTPEQQAAMKQMGQPKPDQGQGQGGQQQPPQPKPYLFVYQLGMPTDVRNYISQPVESFGDALKEFNEYVNTNGRAPTGVVILNVLS